MKKLYKKGDIIFVKYPFTNFIEFKIRPALVLRDQDDDDVLMMAISTTTQLRKVDMIIQDNYYEAKPLPVKSAIRMGKIVTVETDLIVKKFSRLKEEFFKQVQRALFRYLS